MHGIYELKEMLCEELEEYGKKGKLSTGSLDIVDKLAHTIKNLCKIIEDYEDSEDGSYAYEEDGRSMARGGRGGGRGNRGGSYAYARGRGGNARRDSRGRYSSEGYSRNDDMVERLRDLMMDSPDERTKQEIKRLVDKMESM